jgi:hypothetical protein
VDEETFPSSANGKLTLILLDGSPVTELPSSSCANTRNSSHQSSKLLADKVWRRGRDSNSRPCDGRRFSRPVVSTAHPPLPKDRITYALVRFPYVFLGAVKKFCTVVKAFAMSRLRKSALRHRSSPRIHPSHSGGASIPSSVLSSAPRKTFPLLAISLKICRTSVRVNSSTQCTDRSAQCHSDIGLTIQMSIK